MGVRKTVEEIGEFMDNEELTVRHMKILIAITAGFVVGFGVAAYAVVFVLLGY
jgi:hypothetical protein